MNGKTGGPYPSCSNNVGRTGKMPITMVRPVHHTQVEITVS